MRLDETARGVFVIAPTPFTDTGALDEASTDRMVDGFLAAGASGLTILGIMGEAPKLDGAEALAFTARVLKRVAGRVPVIVGVSSPGFASMKALAAGAMDAGAAGVMIAPPAGLRGDDAVVGYIAQAAAVVGDAPYVLQDFPQATGTFMSVEMIRRMAEDPRLVMLKAEDWPGLDKLSALRRLTAEGRMRRISILGGNGGQFLPEELHRGADGIMTGYAFPEMLVQVCRLMAAGDRAAAHDAFDPHLPLIRTELQPGLGLAVRKYVLQRRGFIASAALRAPGPKLSAETQAEVEFLLERLGRGERG
ncbi:dihydrodipicolinate synthase family protein [Siccirubricoccus deserti]|uniref:Dihydrodipicolinate synthase family protein n=1 Tax=Siccirubricoccus deserti TaxID=2013562 RepID=A0A9X0QYF7_9PROT|nr:dihydrodipicolinate synthase family protein [Siccirubricoccus deserti]MBC4015578.1 dihydrodipicolinate synthase family protein [Siccirubricoccus deserti]GGC42844.1 dihydrodipicolinate synthase family protein [Siccirubricoccus deserti]